MAVDQLNTFTHIYDTVGSIVDHQNQGTHAVQVAYPRKRQQHDGGDMMDEHLPEVFSFYVEKLRECQRPIKGQ